MPGKIRYERNVRMGTTLSIMTGLSRIRYHTLEYLPGVHAM